MLWLCFFECRVEFETFISFYRTQRRVGEIDEFRVPVWFPGREVPQQLLIRLSFGGTRRYACWGYISICIGKSFSMELIIRLVWHHWQKFCRYFFNVFFKYYCIDFQVFFILIIRFSFKFGSYTIHINIKINSFVCTLYIFTVDFFSPPHWHESMYDVNLILYLINSTGIINSFL